MKGLQIPGQSGLLILAIASISAFRHFYKYENSFSFRELVLGFQRDFLRI